MKITTHICKTMDLGVSGNLFGGQLMYWLDEAAAVYAMYAANESRMVTLRFAESIFRKPIRAGELIEFFCVDPQKGHTSISFRILAKVRDEIRFESACTFVALDENGHKKNIDWEKSPLKDQTGTERNLPENPEYR